MSVDKTINITIKSSHHERPILTDLVYKKNGRLKPLVIFCHGYKGYKDWGAWNLVAETFAREELFFVKFNFSHNGGTAEDPIDFPDLNAFAENNYILELNDLEDVIQWIRKQEKFNDEIDPEKTILIGHSRGGGIVAIKASEHTAISGVITWSGVSDFGARFPNGNQLNQWKENGIAYVLNSRTNQKMPHLFQFYNNFKEHEKRLTIKNAIEKLAIPHLIIHGVLDDVVLPVEAENMHRWNPRSELFLMDKMNHALGNIQPWKNSRMPEHLQNAVQKSIDFILKRILYSADNT
jgi:pimeloyl-ACP methyl ester carboxylesterase